MSTTVAEDRTNRLIKLLDGLGSSNPQAHVDAITLANPSANKPYHNAQHCITVALYAAEGASWFGYARLDALALVLAGLYHDYGHSSLDENINRPISIAGAIEHISLIEGDNSVHINASVETIISESKVPKRRKAPDFYPARFICDADVMQVLEPDFDLFLEGITEETGKFVTRESLIEDIKKRKMFTRWAKEYALVRILNPDRFPSAA